MLVHVLNDDAAPSRMQLVRDVVVLQLKTRPRDTPDFHSHQQTLEENQFCATTNSATNRASLCCVSNRVLSMVVLDHRSSAASWTQEARSRAK